jgi:hypothetical protein
MGSNLVVNHAATVSDTPWSQFKTSDYTDEQYARACLLDRGVNAGTAKQRYGLPVREPSGTLNRNGCHAAAAVLSSKGGMGSARGSKMNATPEQLMAARRKLIALYNGPLNEDVPQGLGGSMAQADDLVEEFLAHFGVKGMRWGVSKAVHPAIANVPKKTRKEASKDAEEFTRAKLFFGQGAGTRRKLIKAKVEAKKKKDPHYAKAFDHFVKQTDFGQRAAQARAERKRKDVKTTTKKTGKGVANVLRGRSQYANTTAVVGVGAASLLLKRRQQMKQSDDQEESMTQITELGEEFVEHFGVKGMRWGVSKEQVQSGGRAVARVAKDIGFELNTGSQSNVRQIANAASSKMQETDLPELKAKHGASAELRNRIKSPLSKESRAYRQDVRDAYLKRLEESANEQMNASGTRQRTLETKGLAVAKTGKFRFSLVEKTYPNTSKYFWEVSTRDVQHASNVWLTVEPVFDNDGWITDIKQVPNVMAQTMDLGEEFLSHFGIKGMRWGVRKAEAVTTQTHIDTGLARRRTQIEAKGGMSHPAHPDAIKAAIQKQKLKKSGTDALSTDELKSLANRLQLEGQVRTLSTKKGQKFVSKQLEESGKQQLQKGIGIGVKTGGTHVVKKARKGAATVATIAALA